MLLHLIIAMFASVCMAQASIVDLGQYGNTYPVKEKSFKLSIHEGLQDINVSKLREEMLASIEEQFRAKYLLPLSDKREDYIKQNTYIVPFDILAPGGGVAYRKGQIIHPSVPSGMEQNICFVDARYKEILPFVAKEFGKCIYMIANNNLDGKYPALLSNSIDGKIYPVTDRYVKRFGIKFFPTKIKLIGSEIHYTVLNFKKMIKEYQMGELK